MLQILSTCVCMCILDLIFGSVPSSIRFFAIHLVDNSFLWLIDIPLVVLYYTIIIIPVKSAVIDIYDMSRDLDPTRLIYLKIIKYNLVSD